MRSHMKESQGITEAVLDLSDPIGNERYVLSYIARLLQMRTASHFLLFPEWRGVSNAVVLSLALCHMLGAGETDILIA